APDTGRFILQQFVRVGCGGGGSGWGGIDREGKHFVSRCAAKVFQRSRPVGVGICYESVPFDAELNVSVQRLCRELGYFGVFEVEFVRLQQGWSIIDFNPRFYNQMRLDIDRGMPLPLLAYLDACDESQTMVEAIKIAQTNDDSESVVLFDHFTMRAILLVNKFISLWSRDELASQLNWIKQNASRAIDVAGEKND